MKNVNHTHLGKFTNIIDINRIQFTELCECWRQAKMYKPPGALTKAKVKLGVHIPFIYLLFTELYH